MDQTPFILSTEQKKLVQCALAFLIANFDNTTVEEILDMTQAEAYKQCIDTCEILGHI